MNSSLADYTLSLIGNYWNGGEFYGPPTYNSLVLLEKYFAKYPEDASKVVICIKGGMNPKTHQPDASPENTRRTLDDSISQLKGRAKMTLFEFARRDPAHHMKEVFTLIDREYIQTGKIGGLSLSEVRAETIHEAVKYTKVQAVEVELSLYVALSCAMTLLLAHFVIDSQQMPWIMALRQRALNITFRSSPIRPLVGAC